MEHIAEGLRFVPLPLHKLRGQRQLNARRHVLGQSRPLLPAEVLRWLLEGRPLKSAALGPVPRAEPARAFRTAKNRAHHRRLAEHRDRALPARLPVRWQRLPRPIAKNGPKHLRWALIHRGCCAGVESSDLQGPLRQDQGQPRSPTRRQGREYPSSPQARRGHLAQALSRTLPVAVSSE